MKDFKQAINDDGGHANKRKRTILLGNGFSQSVCEEFDYESLYEIAKSEKLDEDKRLSSNLVAIFTKLNTANFEEVLADLNIAKKVVECYPNNEKINGEINTDLPKIRNSFIESIAYTHSDDIFSRVEELKERARKFLEHFGQVFTINYDLLLYWIIMKGDDSLFNDGFGLGDDGNLIWKNTDQKMYYLHGALHLFEFENEYTSKLRSGGEHKLTSQIREKIEKNIYPLVVFEGKSEQKMKSICSNPYLYHSHEKFSSLTGSLFILGSSLSDNDKHIINAIKKSDITHLYVGVCDPGDIERLKQKLDGVPKPKEEGVIFFDSKSVTNDWSSKE